MENDNNKQNISKRIIKFTVILLVSTLTIANVLFTKGFALPWIDTESAWIGFFGSYFSSIATIIGIYWTLQYNREQVKSDRIYLEHRSIEDRRLQHIPFLQIVLKDFKQYNQQNKTDTIVQLDADFTHSSYKYLHIKNIGIGPIIDLEISRVDYEFLHYHVINANDEIKEMVEFRIKNDHKCILEIYYKDLFGNRYTQSLIINLWPEIEKNVIFAFISDETDAEVERLTTI
jgi:hypothetical protein